MNEYMRNAIATHAWHEFIYCKNDDNRKDFLCGVSDSYPIRLDSNEPSIVCVDVFTAVKLIACPPAIADAIRF